ncbi:carbon storage regulator CsrA [Sporomusa sp.]|jgi:carbon storage regulator|uniref:carbon storage regulator CsrA n=1 Tax=Sporomusa sp. TaxID=2078658 RepID=UPI00297965AD|nr:carbon storage regulator CsrA [Sporomusa sp.]MDF2572574.1 csrA [Sporomusa sp.]HWR06981.1 carbon storage regulator CsrA [Sporomusa sp.]
MLALTRKIGERIIVGDNIVFTVVDIKGDSVRLAIEAPKEIKIYRGEIYEAIIAENKQSANPVNLNNMDVLKGIRTQK